MIKLKSNSPKGYYLYEVRIEDISKKNQPDSFYIGKTCDIASRLKNHTGIYRADQHKYFPNRKSAGILHDSNSIRVISVEQIWKIKFKNSDIDKGSFACKMENYLVRSLIQKNEERNESKIYRGGSNLEAWSSKNVIKNDLSDEQVAQLQGAIKTGLLVHPVEFNVKRADLDKKGKDSKDSDIQSELWEKYDALIKELNR